MTTDTDTEELIGFTEYVDALAGLPEDKFLGSIVMMTIHNLPNAQEVPGVRMTLPGHTGIDRETMERWFVELGLDETHLRPDINPSKAFANATGKEATCRYDSPYETELSFVDVTRRGDREKKVRHLMKRVTDRHAQSAHVDTCVAEVIYFRNGPSVKINVIEDALHKDERAIVEKFVEAVARRFQELSQYYTNNAIRWSVREHTKALNAIKLAASGSYFIHRNRQDMVAALGTLVARCPEGSSYHTIPLLDNVYQRERLTEAVEEELDEWSQSLLNAVDKAMEKVKDGKSLTPAAYQALQDECNEAMDRAEEHTRLLDRAAERGAASLEDALLAVAELSKSVDWGD